MLDRAREFVGQRRRGLHGEQPAERAHEAVVRILVVGLAAVAGDSFGADLQPDDLLLGGRDAVDQLARRQQIGAAKATLIEDVLGVEL